MNISAPPATVSAWRDESGHLLAASTTPGLPSAVVELLIHASGLFMASAVNASPDGAALFDAGLRRLVEELVVVVEGPDLAQAAGVEEPKLCPLPQDDGSAFSCTCGEEGRRRCADIALDAGRGEFRLDGPTS